MINEQDLQTFGITYTRTQATGAVWRIVELRHTDWHGEFGGNQHVYVEAIDEQGHQLRGVSVVFEVGGISSVVTLDKGLNEPGANWPIWRGNFVNVHMVGESDWVFRLNGEYGPYKGSDLFHHAWYVVFQRQHVSGNDFELFIPNIQTPQPEAVLPAMTGYPTPEPNTGIGLHDSALVGANPPDIVAHAKALRSADISWYKLLAQGQNKVERARIYRQHGIMPIVRLYSHRPHPHYLPNANDVKAYVDAGAPYIEAGNEPNLKLEWVDGYIPDPASAAAQWIDGAVIVSELGGIPLVFALSPGGDYLHTQFLDDMLAAIIGMDGKEYLLRSAVAIHNRPLHSSRIDEQPSLTRHVFRDYEILQGIITAHVGQQLPMLGTEAGYSRRPSFNGGSEEEAAQRNREIFERANPSHPQAWPDYLLTQCYWLESAGGEWATDEAFQGWCPNAPTAVGRMFLDLRPTWNRNAAQQPAPQPEPEKPAMPQLVFPIVGNYRITQGFGGQHNGIDISVVTGRHVHACDAGTVKEATERGANGRFVRLGHAWGESVYLHLETFNVRAGQSVEAGQFIGRSGNTGNSTGPHLHWGIRIAPWDASNQHKGYTDPMPYLQEQPTPTPQPEPLPTDDVDLLARVITAEARGEPLEGQLAVAHVALNRAAHPGWWGRNLREVLTKKYQFAPPAGKPTETAKAIATLAVAGLTKSPVGDADHFYAVSIPPPSWIGDMTFIRQIGQHRFYGE